MMRTLMAVTILVCLFGSNAEARSRHYIITTTTTTTTATTTTTTTITVVLMAVITAMPVGREHGADGSCARKSAAIPDHPIILRDRGLTTDQMPVAQSLARSSSGVTTSARLSATRTVNGSFRAATMVMRFGPVLDHWPCHRFQECIRIVLNDLTATQHHQSAGIRFLARRQRAHQPIRGGAAATTVQQP